MCVIVLFQTGRVTIDGWLEVAAPAQTAVLFKELRLTLHDILKELIRNPQVDFYLVQTDSSVSEHLLLLSGSIHLIIDE